jgi:hypothetical protein
MKYDEWSFQNLQKLQNQLEEEIRQGQPLKNVLRELNKEISERRFALVGILGGRIRKEYGRWKTPDRCAQQAKAMTLPIDVPYEFEGQKFITSITELF